MASRFVEFDASLHRKTVMDSHRLAFARLLVQWGRLSDWWIAYEDQLGEVRAPIVDEDYRQCQQIRMFALEDIPAQIITYEVCKGGRRWLNGTFST